MGYSLADTAWPIVRHDLENTGSSDAKFVWSGDIQTVFTGRPPYYVFPDNPWSISITCLNVVSGNDELIYTSETGDYSLLKISPDGEGVTEAWKNTFRDPFHPWGDEGDGGLSSMSMGRPLGSAPCVIKLLSGEEGVIGVQTSEVMPSSVASLDSVENLDFVPWASAVVWLATGSGEFKWISDLGHPDYVFYNPTLYPNGMCGVYACFDDWGDEGNLYILFDPVDGSEVCAIKMGRDERSLTVAYGDGKLYLTSERELSCVAIDGRPLWDVEISEEAHMLLSGPIFDKKNHLVYVVSTLGGRHIMTGVNNLVMDHGWNMREATYVISSFDANTGSKINTVLVDTEFWENYYSPFYNLQDPEDCFHSHVAYDEINRCMYIGLEGGISKYNLATNSKEWDIYYSDLPLMQIPPEFDPALFDLDNDNYFSGFYATPSGVTVDGLGNVFVTVAAGAYIETEYGRWLNEGYSALGIDPDGKAIFVYPFGFAEGGSSPRLSDPVILRDGSVVFALGGLGDEVGPRSFDPFGNGPERGLSYVVVAYSSGGDPSCAVCDPNYCSPAHIPLYPKWAGITTLPWDGIDGDEVIFNGEVEWGDKEPTDLWFSIGSRPNAYGYKTKYPITLMEDGNFTYRQLGYPLVSDETFYFRAGCKYGYGDEIKCTVGKRPAHDQTDLGTTETDRFVHAYHDNGKNIIEDIVVAVNSPYVKTFGAMFIVLIIGGILANLAMRGNSLILPGLLLLLCGGTLFKFLPPEAMMFAEMFLIMGIAGLVYWLLTRNR